MAAGATRRAGHAAGPLRPRPWSTSGSGRRPPSFTLHAPNPAHDLAIGGDWVAFGSVASAPNVSDLDGGRRVGNRADYQDLHPAAPDARGRPLLRRLPGRADRPPRVGPPPRRHPRPADARRQADPRLLAWAGSGTSTRSRWCASRAASTTRRSSASRRSSPSSTRRRRCGSTRRCSRASSSSPAQPGHRHDAVHARRARWRPVTLAGRARRAERRGAGRAWS